MCFGGKPKVQHYGHPSVGPRPYNPYSAAPMMKTKHRHGHPAAAPIYVDSGSGFGGSHHGHHGHHGGGGGWFGGDGDGGGGGGGDGGGGGGGGAGC
ncbi:hypothetical protein WAI453_012467 [Rhynchosporium graminicola]